MYKLNETGVTRIPDGMFIPFEEANLDYQHYLLWLAAGNTPEPFQTAAEIAEQQLVAARSELTARTSQANAQVRALQGRITTLDWLIDGQDPDDEDYETPTVADVTERTTVKARFSKWNSYSNKLTKVPSTSGWPATPAWPVAPEPYTSETSAVSTPAS